MMFTRPLADLIVDGKKTATRRRMSDNPRSPWFREKCAYQVGQEFTINPGRGVHRIAEAKVTRVYSQRLGGMGFLDAEKEGFPMGTARGDFEAAWRKINGGYDPLETVWVVEFKLIAVVP